MCLYCVIISTSILSTPYLGGYSAEVPPLPIPNRVVKLSIADGTACCGRVGSRHFERVPLGTLFFLRLHYSSTTYAYRGYRCVLHALWVKRLRRTENVRGTFDGVSAPRECEQPSPLQGHRTPYYRVGSSALPPQMANMVSATLLSVTLAWY